MSRCAPLPAARDHERRICRARRQAQCWCALSELVRTSAAVAGVPGRRPRSRRSRPCCAGRAPPRCRSRWPSCPASCASARSGSATRPRGPARRSRRASARLDRRAADRWPATDAGRDRCGLCRHRGRHRPGRAVRAARLLAALLSRATDGERSFLIRLLAGDLGQGALEGVMTEAIARAAGVARPRCAGLICWAGPCPRWPRPRWAAGAAPATARWPRCARSPCRWAGRCARCSRPRRRTSRRPRADIAGRRGVEDRRNPDPGPPAGPRGEGLHQDARRHHRPGARDRRGRARRRRAAGCSTAKRWPCTRTGAPGPSRSPPGGEPGRQHEHGQRQPDLPLTPFFFDLLHLDGTDLIDAPASERYRCWPRSCRRVLVIRAS